LRRGLRSLRVALKDLRIDRLKQDLKERRDYLPFFYY
jgi:hypothetical protein